VLGLLSGALAKYLMPGRDPSGCIVTIILGILGALIGGLIGTAFGWGTVTGAHWEIRSLALATLGAIVILAAGRGVRSVLTGRGGAGTNRSRERPLFPGPSSSR